MWCIYNNFWGAYKIFQEGHKIIFAKSNHRNSGASNNQVAALLELICLGHNSSSQRK